MFQNLSWFGVGSSALNSLLKENNLADLTDVSAARSNIGAISNDDLSNALTPLSLLKSGEGQLYFNGGTATRS